MKCEIHGEVTGFFGGEFVPPCPACVDDAKKRDALAAIERAACNKGVQWAIEWLRKHRSWNAASALKEANPYKPATNPPSPAIPPESSTDPPAPTPTTTTAGGSTLAYEGCSLCGKPNVIADTDRMICEDCYE